MRTTTSRASSQRLKELQNYFQTQYPGKKDIPIVQMLKGRMREFESDLKWAYYGFTGDAVRHLRLGFYKGDIFTETPTMDRDIPPILGLLREINPDIVTVAFDPEGSGPDTHYKVLQAVSAALKMHEKESGPPRHPGRWLPQCVVQVPPVRGECLHPHAACATSTTWRRASTPASRRSAPPASPATRWTGRSRGWRARYR